MSETEDLEILEEFLRMPLWTSDDVFERCQQLGGKTYGESPARFYYLEGHRSENRVLLMAHADTWWQERQRVGEIEHDIVKENNIWLSSEKVVGLGADDRAGCAMAWILNEELGHSLLITDGEENPSQERDKKGVFHLIDCHKGLLKEIFDKHQFVINLDRHSRSNSDGEYKSIKNYKFYNIQNPDSFVSYVESKLTGYEQDSDGRNADVSNLCRQPHSIAGVNISIGFHNDHNHSWGDDAYREDGREYIDIRDWLSTLNILRRWLSEERIPRYETREVP